MRTINNGISRIQEATEDTFFDSCKIITCSSYIQDSYGEKVPIKISGAEINCGHQIINGSLNYRGEIIVSDIDAKVRLPLGTAITVLDEVLITKKNGVATNTLYKVDAVLPGLSCLTINLSKPEA